MWKNRGECMTVGSFGFPGLKAGTARIGMLARRPAPPDMRAYCKLSCVSFTAQRVEQVKTLTTPWVLKYTLEACPAVLVLSTIIPLTPPE
jgi:hypothetical protein